MLLILLSFKSISAQSDVLTITETIVLPVQGITQVQWSPDGTLLALKSWKFIQIWDTETRELVGTIQPAFSYDMAWHPTLPQIATLRGDCTQYIFVYDAFTGDIIHQFERPERAIPIRCPIFSRTLTWNREGTALIFDTVRYDGELLSWEIDAQDNPTILRVGERYTITDTELSNN